MSTGRGVMGIVAAAVLAGTVVAGPPVAAATTVPAGTDRSAPVVDPPFLTMGDGTVVLRVSGAGRFRLAELVAQRPCFRFATSTATTTACLRSTTHAHVTQSGRTPFRLPVTISRHSRGALDITARRADLMLPTGRAIAQAWCRGDCGRTTRAARVPVLRIDTCEASGPWLVRGAPQPVGKAVALTFDDGPGLQTDDVLRMLKDEGVPGTFFQVGVNMGSGTQLRQMLKAGHVLGNHTYGHVMSPGHDEIARASERLRQATGFRTCVFRAPGGVNPPAVVGTARSLGMVTVNWNVDPFDWRGTNAAEIVRVSMAQTRPGSILLYHDGSSNHATVPAVRQVIHNLKAKGYRFLTVPELLGLAVTYR